MHCWDSKRPAARQLACFRLKAWALIRPGVRALLLFLIFSAGPVQAHDPSAWGGLFRSRDDGATWTSANRGYYLSGAIALAINPTKPNELLLGTESGLFRSRNGGRDWSVEAPSVV